MSVRNNPNRQVTVRITPKEYEIFKKICDKDDRPVSSMIHKLVVDCINNNKDKK
jgi:hypothetical protein